ncbi:TPA: hypothetical protein NKT40_001048 [Vibrio parahaemolyticus]|nr:hypothetical protein [Vibrio parahaemolyticus]
MDIKANLFQFLDEDKKFLVPKREEKYVFLPSTEEVFTYLGLGSSYRNLMKHISKVSGGKIPVSDSTLDNIHKTGISSKSAKKVLSFMFDELGFFESGLLHMVPPKPVAKFDTTYEWIGLIKGVELRNDKICDKAYYISYLKERIGTEQQALEAWAQGDQELNIRASNYLKVGLDNSLLSDLETQAFLQAQKRVLEMNGIPSMSTEDIQAIMRYKLDFYLSLLASIDVTILNQMLIEGGYTEADMEDASKWPKYGIFHEIFSFEGKCHFDCFLCYIAKLLDVEVGALAKFINIDRQDSGEGVTLDMARSHRLKEWRRGDTKPSFDRFENFIYEAFSRNGFDFAVIGFLCEMLDRLYNAVKGITWNELVNPDVYKKYYQYHKSKAAY